ncbi:MAG: DUF177 domain-containing protein [Deltaproteobacteria bacterium]|nr:DUF177 domain-containing protein [Deltaproteobacteria bacterium]
MKPSDLQLNLHEIPEAGLTLEGTLPAEWAAESLLDPYRALSPVALRLEVERMADNVLVRGQASLRLGFECSRTSAPAEVELVAPFAELFMEGGKHHHNLVELEVSSDEVVDEPWVIEDGKIDLEALVRESIVLAQDPYPLAPGVERGDEDEAAAPVWTSAAGDIDPRWERLKNLKLD